MFAKNEKNYRALERTIVLYLLHSPHVASFKMEAEAKTDGGRLTLRGS
jgi:hypothetical protein